MARILFQGDSLTDGNRCKLKEQAWDGNHQMGHSYAYIVNGILGSRYPEKNLEFVNRGVSGNRIVDIYARMEPDIIELKPDVLSIMVGINDIPSDWNGVRGTSPEKYEMIYRQLLKETKAALPKVHLILCEPVIFPVCKQSRDYALCEQAVCSFGQVVRRLAEEFSAELLLLQEEFENRYQMREPEYWSWDGIHPTENGHGVIAVKWMELFEQKLLPKL